MIISTLQHSSTSINYIHGPILVPFSNLLCNPRDTNQIEFYFEVHRQMSSLFLLVLLDSGQFTTRWYNASSALTHGRSKLFFTLVTVINNDKIDHLTRSTLKGHLR